MAKFDKIIVTRGWHIFWDSVHVYGNTQSSTRHDNQTDNCTNKCHIKNTQ